MSWFAFFPGDWLSNRDVKRMSLDQRGAYIQLLCWQWQGEGYLDGTDQDIAALGDMIGREWTDERVAQVLQKFPRAADGRRANTKLLNIWQEAARIHSARRRSAENTNANRYGHRPCAASVTESVTDTVTESVGDPSPSPSPPPHLHPPPKEEEDSSEPAHKKRRSKPAVPIVDPQYVQIHIPIIAANGLTEYPITKQQADEWETLFPAVDVPQTLRDIRAWNLANRSRRKTPGGVLRHVVSWLSREQNKG